MKKIHILLVTFMLMLSSNSHAVLINAYDRGFYSDEGEHFSWNTNYSAGSWTGVPFSSRWVNFFAFDLTGLSGTVTSATFYLDAALTDNGTYDSTSGIYDLYDVDTSISALLADSTTDVSIYTDLGSGTNYGSLNVSTSDNYQVLGITLNSSALADITSNLGGDFAIGGDISNNFRIGGLSQTQSYTPRLSLEFDHVEVPEPSTFALLSLGLAGICWTRRKAA